METDSEMEKNVKKWFRPPTEKHKRAFEYLTDLIRKMKWQPQGIIFHEVPHFMAEQGMKMDMVKAIGLETLPHLLFHMDDLLEVRCREINGRPFYYLSLIETGNGRRNLNPKKDHSANKEEDEKCEETVVTTFSKILNLHRSHVIPPAVESENRLSSNGKTDSKSYGTKIHKDEKPVAMTASTVAKSVSSSSVPSTTEKVRGKKIAQPEPESKVVQNSVENLECPPDMPSHPIVRIKRTFVFGPPEEPHERYRFTNTAQRYDRRSGWSEGGRPRH